MIHFTKAQIDHFAEQLLLGIYFYINKQTGEFIPLKSSIHNEWILVNNLKIRTEQINDHWDVFVLKNMIPIQSFEIIKAFVPKVKDRKIKKALKEALSNKKPVRNFRKIVRSHQETKKQWEEYHANVMQIYITNELASKMNVSFDPIENLNEKSFRLIQNSKSGEANSETIIRFKQEENILNGEYFGGNIKLGNILGKIDFNKIELLYQCVTKDEQLKSGKATGLITLKNGKIIIKLDWEWLNAGKEKGKSEYHEI